MVTVAQPNSVEDIASKLESLEHVSPEMEEPSLAEMESPEQDASDAVGEEQEQLPERGADVEEAEMMVHPFNTPIQVMGLCQRLKTKLRAEIIHVLKSHDGTVIRVSLRSEQSLLDFLTKEEEVSEVWEELIPREDRPVLLPHGVDSDPVMKNGMAAIVCVALKPTYIDALIDSHVLAAAG